MIDHLDRAQDMAALKMLNLDHNSALQVRHSITTTYTSPSTPHLRVENMCPQTNTGKQQLRTASVDWVYKDALLDRKIS